MSVSTARPVPVAPFSRYAGSMGGRLAVHLDVDGAASSNQAAQAAGSVIARVDRWAARLTRHSPDSELVALNADPRHEVPVRPTLAAALRASRLTAEHGQGLVDVTLLDARLAAEGLWSGGAAPAVAPPPAGPPLPGWSLVPGPRGAATVRRSPGIRFDLDGTAKGWIADRALGLLGDWPGAVVDADGDLAIRCAPGRAWEIAVADPRASGGHLAILRLEAPPTRAGRWGVATSGVSVHRWTIAGRATHHLIDPRTGRPAATDAVQATVVAGSALRAEALAKAAVIAGSAAGLALLERAGVAGAIVLTDRGEALALPQTLSLLEG